MVNSSAILRIVFWEPSVSPHKIDLVRGIAGLSPALQVVYVADQGIPADRQAMGWSVANIDFDLVVAPSSEVINELVRTDPAGTLHVFSGIRWVPSIVAAIAAVRRHKANFAILSEPRAANGVSGFLRYLHSWATEHWFRRNARFVLAIGRNGPPWFRRVGYADSKVFPFAYFVSAPPSRDIEGRTLAAGIRVGFVGRLVREKGVFDLIDALAIHGNSNLTVIGDGPERRAMEQRCADLGVMSKFEGVRPISEVPEMVREVDVLVLASTAKDGWGAVISEALLVGTAVIATSETGGSMLLDVPGNGVLVPKRSPRLIARALEDLMRTGAFDAEARVARRNWASGCLTGVAGAKYFLDISLWSEGTGFRPTPFHLRAQGVAN